MEIQDAEMKETEWIQINSPGSEFSEEEEKNLRRAGRIIRSGGIVAFPTETVYGLGGDALNRESSRRIYEAKGRPSDNPLIVHICEMQDLEGIARDIPEEARRLAAAFWPGPLTMILNKSEAVPSETTGGLKTVAVRMPSNEIARRLIAYSGGYVAAPSANVSGRPSPTAAKYVFEDMAGKIDMIIDGGESVIGLESTIVDMTVKPPQILRPGYITGEMLESVLGEIDTDVTILQFQPESGQAPRAPGMKYRHYAPRGELVIVQGEPDRVVAYINEKAALDSRNGERTGIIGTGEQLERYRGHVVRSAGSRADEESIARRLYAILREFDDEGVTKIYSESFSTEGIGQAIMNRLLKAAGHHVISLADKQEAGI